MTNLVGLDQMGLDVGAAFCLALVAQECWHHFFDPFSQFCREFRLDGHDHKSDVFQRVVHRFDNVARAEAEPIMRTSLVCVAVCGLA